MTECTITRFSTRGGKINGVQTDQGTIATEIIINACGKLIPELITNKQTLTLDISYLEFSRFKEGQRIGEYNAI